MPEAQPTPESPIARTPPEPKKVGQGRPRYKPSPEQRNLVAIAASSGMRHADIAKSLAMDLKSLYRHFRDELDNGLEMVNASVVMTGTQMALSGQHDAMTMFFLKCRLGWRDRDPNNTVVQINGKGDEAVEVASAVLLIPAPVEGEDWRAQVAARQAKLLEQASVVATVPADAGPAEPAQS